MWSPRSLMRAFTRPQAGPATIGSPTRSVPRWIDGRRHRPTADVEVRLEDDAAGVDLRVRPQLEHLGEHDELLEHVVDAEVLQRRHLDGDRVAAPCLGHEPLLGELLHDAVRVGVLAVDLVEGHHDRHVGRLGVVDRLDRLRHDAVVGGHDEHDDVGHARPAGAHGGEGLVAGGVDEREGVAVPLDLVGADVLGDPARLAGDDVRLADPVEQQGLAVVDVTHHRDDGRPRPEVALLLVFVIGLVPEEAGPQRRLLLLAGVDEPDAGADLGGEELDHVVGEGLGGGHHLPLQEEEAHDVAGRPVELRPELLRRRAPLDDHLGVGHRRVRRHVSRHLDRLELLHVAATPAGPPLRWPAAAAGASSDSARGTSARRHPAPRGAASEARSARPAAEATAATAPGPPRLPPKPPPPGRVPVRRP